MASDGRERRDPRRALWIPLLLTTAVALAMVAFAGQASAEVVYENAPNVTEGAPAVLGFEDTGTAELGSLLRFAGEARLEPVVRVPLAVGQCDETWGSLDCGAAEPTFPLDATLTVYATDAAGAVGQQLVRQSQTFELGFDRTQEIAFPLAGLPLPAEAIVSLAFDTGTGGYQPTGAAGPADAVAVALAGPAAVGASPREAEGIYLARAAGGEPPVFEFAADPGTYEGLQPAFTVEAAAPEPPAPEPGATAIAAPSAATAASIPRTRAVPVIPPSRRMTLAFPRRTARVAGPGALIQVRCRGTGAARCIGTLALGVAGAVHKAPYSISKGRRQYVVVPLGDDLGLIDSLPSARATVSASTIQANGAAVTAKKTLRLK